MNSLTQEQLEQIDQFTEEESQRMHDAVRDSIARTVERVAQVIHPKPSRRTLDDWYVRLMERERRGGQELDAEEYALKEWVIQLVQDFLDHHLESLVNDAVDERITQMVNSVVQRTIEQKLLSTS